MLGHETRALDHGSTGAVDRALEQGGDHGQDDPGDDQGDEPSRHVQTLSVGLGVRAQNVIVRNMSEYQITYWRDIPSMVMAREGDETARAQLAQRFQEAIDEAAMRLGESDADAYMEGWRRGEWTPADGSPADVVQRVAEELEVELSEEALTALLDELGPAQGA